MTSLSDRLSQFPEFEDSLRLESAPRVQDEEERVSGYDADVERHVYRTVLHVVPKRTCFRIVSELEFLKRKRAW